MPQAQVRAESLRRGLLISPPMNDAASGPVHANAITDQKIRSLSAKPGRIVSAVIGVAEPNRHSAAAPSAMSSSVIVHRAKPPALFSHFAITRP